MVTSELRRDSPLIAETSLTESSIRGTPRHLPPLLRRRGSGEESTEDISQRLGPPLTEVIFFTLEYFLPVRVGYGTLKNFVLYRRALSITKDDI